MKLPTRTAMFENTLAELNNASLALSAAAEWLGSDWTPVDSALTHEAGQARMTIMCAINEAKAVIGRAKCDANEAIDSLRDA